MKFLSLILSPLILLGAGCAITTPSSVVDVTAVETSTPTPILTTSYVMSSDLLMFSAPSDWSVVQRDGAGGSAIEIESPLGVLMVISVEIAETFEGTTIAYQDWLASDFDFSDAGSTTIVGGYRFDVHEVVTDDQNGRWVLTSEIQGEDRRYFVDIWLPLDAQTSQQVILDSLKFNPNVEERSTAQVIR